MSYNLNPGESVGINRRFKDMSEFLAKFLGVQKSYQPDSETALIEAIIAEAFRIAASQQRAQGGDWPTCSVLSLRSWVLNKIKGIIIGGSESLGDITMQILNGRLGPSLVFIGDFVALPSGYYVPAPTRAMPITDDTFILISGEPTTNLLNNGLSVRIHGVARWIVEADPDEFAAHNIRIQQKSKYFDNIGLRMDALKFLEMCSRSGAEREWTSTPASEFYLGPVAGRVDFVWGASSPGIETPFGRIRLARSPREYSRFDYALRIDKGSSISRTSLDPTNYKRALLAYDSLAGNQRKAVIARRGSELFLELDFSPPAAETRWIHALGGTWLGLQGSHLGWKLPGVVEPLIEETVRGMWLKLDRRG